MQKLSPLRLGIAFGVAGAVFYVGCMIFMRIAPNDSVVWLSNSVLHGVDIATIMRSEVPIAQSLTGICLTAIGGLIFGMLSACLYNVGLNSNIGAE